MNKGLVKWERMPLFSSFQDDMDRMLESFFGRETSFGTGWSPDIDIAETNDSIIVKVEIPGIAPKDIDISITGDILTVKGEKKEEKKEEGKCHHRIERSYGSFSRTIRLPESVNTDKVKAEDHHGLLEITIPKTEKAREKKISVKVA